VNGPSCRPFPVADPAPVLEFRRDFHGHAGVGIDPAYLLILVRTGPRIDPIGLEAHESWDRKPADGAAAPSRADQDGEGGNPAIPAAKASLLIDIRKLCLVTAIWYENDGNSP